MEKNATGSALPVLSIRNLSKKLGGRPILHNISLDVYPGEIFGFLGPNGSGKTTTIKLMLGLLHIEEGEISICGHNIATDFEAAVANIGGIIENPEMYSYLTGRQNLEQYRRMYDFIPEERIDDLVRLVGLEGRIDDKISKYSLGMRQRLGIAQALINSPRLLVLDEPTNGLDPAGIRHLRDILKYLAHTEGVSVFVSSHLLAELELMCDRVGVIDRGHLVGINSMEEMHRTASEGLVSCEIHLRNRDKALEVLSRLGVTPEGEGEKITITVKEEALPDTVRELATGGAEILYIIPVKRSLEDAFLEMTRENAVNGGKGK